MTPWPSKPSKPWSLNEVTTLITYLQRSKMKVCLKSWKIKLNKQTKNEKGKNKQIKQELASGICSFFSLSIDNKI